MRHEVNDVVEVRSWDDMAKEYPVGSDGISVPFFFSTDMRGFCGKKFKIKSISVKSDRVIYQLHDPSCKKENGYTKVEQFSFSKEMLISCYQESHFTKIGPTFRRHHDLFDVALV